MPAMEDVLNKAHHTATEVYEHFLGSWEADPNVKGAFVTTCEDCKMAVAVHPSGHYFGPAVTETCPMYLRALAEEREGVSDALGQGSLDDDEGWP